MAGCKSASFLLAILAVTPLLGRLHGARVLAPEDLARPGGTAARTPDLQAHRRRRDARDAVDGIRGGGADVQRRLDAGALRHAAPAARPAAQPAGIWPGRAGSGVQHRRVVHDEHELAGLRRRDDHELFHADGRARVPQLRLGRGRHLRRHRLHSRHRTAGKGHARELLGRHGAGDAVGAAADLDRRRALPRLARRRAEPQAVRQGRGDRSADRQLDRRRRQTTDDRRQRTDHRPGTSGVAGDHQAVRHQWRRLLQRQQLASVRESHAADELPRRCSGSSRSRPVSPTPWDR